MSFSITPKSNSIFSSHQRKSLARASQDFKPSIRQQGTQDLINGLVDHVLFQNGSLIGEVHARDPIRVIWKHLGEVWRNECSCPASSNCRHAYAVAHYALQHETSVTIRNDHGTEEEKEDSFDHQIDRLLTLVSNKKTAPQKNSTVHSIIDAKNVWDGTSYLGALCDQLGFKFDESQKGWLTIFKTENREKRAWLLTHELLKHTSRLPEELEIYRHHQKFEAEEIRKNEEDLILSIREWITQIPSKNQKAQHTLTIRWSWEGVKQGGGPHIQFFISGKKSKDVPRTPKQMRSFASSATRTSYLFNQDDKEFLIWFQAQFSELVEDYFSEDDEIQLSNSGHALYCWLTSWGRTRRCFWGDDQPVQLALHTAHILPKICKSKDQEAPHFEFEVEIENGVRLPLEQVRLILPSNSSSSEEPVFIFYQNVFYLVDSPPPLHALNSLIQKKEWLLHTPSHLALLPAVLQRFPSFIQNGEDFIHHHPAKLTFSFSLQPNDWLCVRLHAHSRESHLKWEFTRHGWIQQDHLSEKPTEPSELSALETNGNEHLPVKPAKLKEHVLHLPHAQDLEIPQQWLESMDFQSAEETSFDPEHGWWLLLNSAKIDDLLNDWKNRPLSAEYWANPAFRALVAPNQNSTPRIRIHSSGMDWFSISAEWQTLAASLSLADYSSIQESREKFIKLSNGRWVHRKDAEQAYKISEGLSQLGIDPLSEQAQPFTLWQMLAAKEGALDQLSHLVEADTETWKTLQEIKKKLTEFQGLPDVPFPRRLRATMRNYQQEGLKFLAYVSSLKLGAILADDMGLGKTLQALAWLEHLRDKDGASPCLVICPASVVYNWQREAQKFVDGSKILLLTSGEERHGLRKEIPGHDLVITNYALLRRDLDELRQFKFRAVILDEAQYIKNPDSQVAKAAKQIVSEHRLALTGTPLENRLLDLWSIVDFVTPGYLGTRAHFTESYDSPDKPHRRTLLKTRLQPILLRRLKREVAPDLPDRIEERQDCELTEGQRSLYLSELKRAREMIIHLESEQQIARKKMHVLAALTRLRQICCHPSLIGEKEIIGSGKTSALMDILEPLLAEGHKVLVFSQFVKMLNLLEKEFEQASIPYHILTGQSTKREQIVQAFQEDPRASVFLLSLKAAGTGLNLTAASYVVLYDPWWNPAVEAQAIDRTHRIGQDRTVITYRLVVKSTVEDKIYQLQQRKASMVKDVLGEEGFAKSLTQEDLLYLFKED